MKGLIILVFTTVIAWSAYADQPKYCNIQFPSDARQFYPQSVKSAKEALKGLCDTLDNDGKISADALNDLFVSFHSTLETETRKNMPDLMPYLVFFKNPLFEYGNLKATAMIPDVRFFTDPSDLQDTIYVQATGSHQNNYELAIPREVALKCYTDNDCRTNLKSYRDLLFFVYNPFKAEYVSLSQTFSQ